MVEFFVHAMVAELRDHLEPQPQNLLALHVTLRITGEADF